jgi:hypothetical protein
VGITLFYVVLTPIWLGLRIAGWLADIRAHGFRLPASMIESSEGES